MAGKGYSSIQLLNSDDDSDEEMVFPDTGKDLKFEDYSSASIPSGNLDDSSQKSTQRTLDNSDDDDEDDEKELLSSDKKQPSFWSFEYYQSFFDVDTTQVTSRMLHSMIPSRQNFVLTKIRPNPDLYGPFWICSTLVFTIAICGNLSSFFASEGGPNKWKSDFQLVSLSAGVIFGYAWIVPTSVWAYLLWRGNQVGFTFLEIVCVYGYSLTIFIPISILWIVPYDWLRWILVLIGVFASGSVLISTFWLAMEDDNKKFTILSICFIVLFHAALAIGFKLYFFKSIKIHEVIKTTMATITPLHTKRS